MIKKFTADNEVDLRANCTQLARALSYGIQKVNRGSALTGPKYLPSVRGLLKKRFKKIYNDTSVIRRCCSYIAPERVAQQPSSTLHLFGNLLSSAACALARARIISGTLVVVSSARIYIRVRDERVYTWQGGGEMPSGE